MKIYPYNQGSASAKALSQALGALRINHEGRPLNIRGGLVINWGASRINRDLRNVGVMLNNPEAVAKASNKLHTLRSLQEAGVAIPQWTTDAVEASEWLNEPAIVVARHKLNGHSGEGIELVDPENIAEGDAFPEAPLYTKYIKKQDEYRLHVFGDKVIFEQRKARKKDVPDDQVNWKIRNHGNGFIFAHQDVIVGAAACELAVAAVQALGLDFGAVDMIRTKKGEFFVLEVNTACGLEGETLNRYVEAFNAVL